MTAPGREQDEWDGTFTPEQAALHAEIAANTDALLATLDRCDAARQS